jgi:hypothetical protein
MTMAESITFYIIMMKLDFLRFIITQVKIILIYFMNSLAGLTNIGSKS